MKVYTALAGALILVNAHLAAWSQYSTASKYMVGKNPRSLDVGDVDCDGILDIVVADYGAGDVSVLVGLGGGLFAVYPMTVPVGSGPEDVVLEDLDQDSVLDLVTANWLSSDMTVLLGSCPGVAFSAGPSSPHATGTQPHAVAIGDINSIVDACKDAVTADYNGNQVSVFLQTTTPACTGDFGSATGHLTQANPESVAIADLDLDGDADLVVANLGADSISVLSGDGLGGFTSARYPACGRPRYAVAEDLDGDGDADIVWVNESCNSVEILLNNGAGGFAPPPVPSHMVGTKPYTVAVGDMDLDGFKDLAVANYGGNTVDLLLGNGAGGFVPSGTLTVGSRPQRVALEDVNVDGLVDLIVTHDLGDDVWVYLNGLLGLTGPTPGVVGVVNTTTVSNATPGGWVGLGFSSITGSTPVGTICPGLMLGLGNPVLVGLAHANANGSASFSAFVPPGLSGKTVFLQGADLAACAVTNLVSHSFL